MTDRVCGAMGGPLVVYLLGGEGDIGGGSYVWSRKDGPPKKDNVSLPFMVNGLDAVAYTEPRHRLPSRWR